MPAPEVSQQPAAPLFGKHKRLLQADPAPSRQVAWRQLAERIAGKAISAHLHHGAQYLRQSCAGSLKLA